LKFTQPIQGTLLDKVMLSAVPNEASYYNTMHCWQRPLIRYIYCYCY